MTSSSKRSRVMSWNTSASVEPIIFLLPLMASTAAPGSGSTVQGPCPDRNHGSSKPRKRLKYRKVKVGQANLRGLDVNGAFWGKYMKLTENFLEA